MKHVLRTNPGVLLLLLVAASSVESIADSNSYRWQNSHGETVFSDQPPPSGEKYEVIRTPTSPPPVEESEAGNDSPEETASSGSGEGDSQNNAELCKRAKMNLAVLEGPDKVSVRNEQGEVHEISAEERTIMQQTAKAKIEVYCK